MKSKLLGKLLVVLVLSCLVLVSVTKPTKSVAADDGKSCEDCKKIRNDCIDRCNLMAVDPAQCKTFCEASFEGCAPPGCKPLLE
jgi:competence protein ComGC